MRKRFFIIVLAMLGMTQVMAQDYEYVPFVREGVKWVYRYNNPFSPDILDMDFGLQYYSFEMKGDFEIGGKNYKQVILTHYLTDNEKEVEDFIPVYLREENKVVYAIHPDGIWYPQCPVGYGRAVTIDSNPNDPYNPYNAGTGEFILYDFNDPIALYDSVFQQTTHESVAGKMVDYLRTDTMSLGFRLSRCHHYRTWYSEDDMIIESIGYNGEAGMPLFYFEVFITGFQVGYQLNHVIENGEIIYKSRYYDPDIHVGIDEVVTNVPRGELDGNYYNLMGQPVGKEVPTTPGIYIHQGKKIIVR